MRRQLAILWLGVIVAATGYLGWRFADGAPFRTDLMALLPVTDHDPAVARAKQAMTELVARRIVVLVGHRDRGLARRAATEMAASLARSGVLSPADAVPDSTAAARLGAAYFPYRSGLLSETDRRRLLEDRGQDIVNRALSQIYGFASFAGSRLLRNDPFLLFPEFLKGLPHLGGQAFPDDGLLTIQDEGRIWIVVSGELAGDPFALGFQSRFQQAWDAAMAAADDPGEELSVLRLGTIFYARAGASEALAEASIITACAVVGAIALMLLAFHSVTPLALGVLSILAGLVAALSASVVAFGTPHVAVLLFGAGLIGVTVDYSVHYFAQIFTPRAGPAERLRRVLPGMLLGAGTTAIGYCALAIAPYPGLRQVAVFSVIGVTASLLTVILWFPLLDRVRPRPLPAAWRRMAALTHRLWTEDGLRRVRITAAIVALAVGVAGFSTMRTEDDIRRQQMLPPHLVTEQSEIQRLAGIDTAGQFFLVEAKDEEEALASEESLAARLAPLVKTGALAGWRSPADFVPSIARQRENRRLIEERLEKSQLAGLQDRLGMTPGADERRADDFLDLRRVRATGLAAFLDALVLDDAKDSVLHVVALQGLTDPAAARRAGDGLAGVRFIDPAADVTALLGNYRRQAVWLLGGSILLMVPLLAVRHGWRGGLRIMAPPSAAVVLAPSLLALCGLPFTFFAAMALVLVLAIGVDYAIFCAEDGAGEAATLTAVTLATLTTMLSFGLLAFSHTAAVQTFGITMLTGIAIAFLVAPGAASKPPR
ncbi:MAG: hypothetical protein IH626_13200 [Rhodospirillales bacterium]|nr:hypothetical protein [Rhodospirillales bacterium]